jgi:hypothetical protein
MRVAGGICLGVCLVATPLHIIRGDVFGAMVGLIGIIASIGMLLEK